MIFKNLLYDILRIQSYSRECIDMQNFLVDYADNKGYKIDVDDADNIYLTKGVADTYPCAVAHMDTVHRITKAGIEIAQFVGNDNILFGINPITKKPTGIGGDDKCGIYAALHCMELLPAFKIAFFVDEEIGCLGSSRAEMSFFDDCRFVLQADRRGNNDFVTNICGPLSSTAFMDDIQPIIKMFGFSFVNGMMTDVEALRDNDIGISVANMSAGYYLPHTDNEFINVTDLENICNMMMEIYETMESVYPFHYVKPKYDYKMQVYNGGHPKDSRGAWWQNFNEEEGYYGPLMTAEEANIEKEMLQDVENSDILEECDGDEIFVEGKRKNIMEMSDKEWEEWEKEQDRENNWLHELNEEEIDRTKYRLDKRSVF